MTILSYPGTRLRKRQVNALSIPAWALLALMFLTRAGHRLDRLGFYAVMSVLFLAGASCFSAVAFDIWPTRRVWTVTISLVVLATVAACALGAVAIYLRATS